MIADKMIAERWQVVALQLPFRRQAKDAVDGVSVINILEFLGFDGLSDSDRDLFAKFVSRVSVVDLVSGNGALMAAIADLRKRKGVKFPDAIVVASAALHRATLLTNDAQLLKLAADEPGYPAVPFWQLAQRLASV